MPLEPIAGFPTFWQDSGSGKRRALFIHCTMAHSGAWTGVQEHLGDRLNMRVFDRPSHGKSARWDGTGGAAGLIELTASIAAELAGGKVDIVGHSFGATVALQLAGTMPDLVRSLTLIEPVVTLAAQGHKDHAAYLAGMHRFHDALTDGNRTNAARLFNDMVSPEAPFDTLHVRVQEKLTSQIHLIWEEADVTLKDVTGLLEPGKIEALAMPVLLMAGGRSPALMRQVNETLAARLPDARNIVIDRAGHMAPITHPQAVAAAIAGFLDL